MSQNRKPPGLRAFPGPRLLRILPQGPHPFPWRNLTLRQEVPLKVARSPYRLLTGASRGLVVPRENLGQQESPPRSSTFSRAEELCSSGASAVSRGSDHQLEALWVFGGGYVCRRLCSVHSAPSCLPWSQRTSMGHLKMVGLEAGDLTSLF